MKSNNIKKYNQDGQLTYDYEPISGILYEYEYTEEERVITIQNPKNRSNYKTTIIQIKKGNDYINKQKEEEGETYLIKTTFDIFGRELVYEKINKIKKTNFRRENLKYNGDKSSIWLTDSNGSKSIGFKADLDKLKNI